MTTCHWQEEWNYHDWLRMNQDLPLELGIGPSSVVLYQKKNVGEWMLDRQLFAVVASGLLALSQRNLILNF